MPIKRFFSDDVFLNIKKDFAFLTKIIQKSEGEYDLSIRDNYFNLYYKGYSISKIKPNVKDHTYSCLIHPNFFNGTDADNEKFYTSKKKQGEYFNILLTKEQLHPFLQQKHLAEFATKAKKENSGEIGFEQSVITDNLNRDCIIIIDRQITDTELKRRRLDLLALKQVEGRKYQFQLLEVKLGNNKELEGDVADQLRCYVDHISQHFNEYKKCYELQYIQKRELGIIHCSSYDTIEIVEPVLGLIVVGGYSGLAKSKITLLRKEHPELEVRTLFHEL